MDKSDIESSSTRYSLFSHFKSSLKYTFYSLLTHSRPVEFESINSDFAVDPLDNMDVYFEIIHESRQTRKRELKESRERKEKSESSECIENIETKKNEESKEVQKNIPADTHEQRILVKNKFTYNDITLNHLKLSKESTFILKKMGFDFNRSITMSLPNPIHWSIIENKASLLQDLLESLVDFGFPGMLIHYDLTENLTPIMTAAYYGRYELLKLMIEMGVSIKHEIYMNINWIYGKHKCYDALSIARAQWEYEKDLYQKTKNAFFQSSLENLVDIIEFLEQKMSEGPTLKLLSPESQNKLQEKYNFDLTRGINDFQPYSFYPKSCYHELEYLFLNPLQNAAVLGDLDLMKDLILHKADLNIRDPKSFLTPILWAVRYGRVSAVRLLIEQGANLERRNVVVKSSRFSGLPDVSEKEIFDENLDKAKRPDLSTMLWVFTNKIIGRKVDFEVNFKETVKLVEDEIYENRVLYMV